MNDFVRLGHGLYRPAGSLTSMADRIGAYLDALPPGTVVGGLAAARMYGLWLPEATPDERLEFVLNRPATHARELAASRRGEILTRRRALAAEEIVLTDHFPMLSPARVWVDLCETLSLEDVVSAGDSLLRGLATHDDLVAAIAMARHRRGVRRARHALTLLDPRSRSRGETHLRCALVLGGLPRPEVNMPIFTEHGEWLAEPDLHYKAARLALEYNGGDHAGVRRMRKDITRELDIDGHGWKVIVFGPNEVFRYKWRLAPYIRGQLQVRDPDWWRRQAG